MRLRAAEVAGLAHLVAGASARALAGRIRRGPLRAGWTLRTELTVAGLRAVLMHSKQRGIPWLRAVQALEAMLPSAPARNVHFESTTLGGVAARVCVPRGDPSVRHLVYLHGGGYVIGSPETHRDLIARLALGVRARVVAVDYRLAPEHPFPAALDDCSAALRALVASGVDPRRLAVAGDSAGGALAVAALCALRDAGDPLPAAAVLLCPWTEPLAEGGSLETNALADFGDRELLVGWARCYAPGDAALDPRVSVAHARLDGLPPLLVQVGGAEILLDPVRAFAARARAAGVPVRLDEHPGMFHDWQLQAGILPEGARAVDDIVDWLRERLA